MRRILLLFLGLGIFFPAILFAQGVSPSQDSDSGSFLSSLPIVQAWKAGKIVLNPSLQISYQHIGANMNLPASDVPRGANELFIGPMDVIMRDFNFWSATLGLNIIAEPITVFGSIGGYSPRLFKMEGIVPISSNIISIVPGITFTGSHLDFWTAQCGAGYSFGGGYSVLAGYIWTHLGARFTDPTLGSTPLPNQTLVGDVSMNVGVPFIGLQILETGYYRAALLYSPLARSSGALSLQTSAPEQADLRYTLNQPGTFLALNAEYYFLFHPPLILSCWFLGSYYNIRGSSDLEFTSPGPAVTRDVTITDTQYGLAGGFTFGLMF